SPEKVIKKTAICMNIREFQRRVEPKQVPRTEEKWGRGADPTSPAKLERNASDDRALSRQLTRSGIRRRRECSNGKHFRNYTESCSELTGIVFGRSRKRVACTRVRQNR